MSSVIIPPAPQVVVIEHRRRWLTPFSTIGEIHRVDGPGETFRCFSLEDVYRGGLAKVPGASAIPVGEYDFILVDSPRFGPDTLSIEGVPGFQNIRAHGGNDPHDTLGCVLVGRVRLVDRIEESQLALQALKAELVPLLKTGWRGRWRTTVEP